MNKKIVSEQFQLSSEMLGTRAVATVSEPVGQETLERSQKHQQICCRVLPLLYHSYESISVQIT